MSFPRYLTACSGLIVVCFVLLSAINQKEALRKIDSPVEWVGAIVQGASTTFADAIDEVPDYSPIRAFVFVVGGAYAALVAILEAMNEGVINFVEGYQKVNDCVFWGWKCGCP